MKKIISGMVTIALFLTLILPVNMNINQAEAQSTYLSPSAAVAGSDGNLYIANETGNSITVFRMSDETVLRTIELPGSPGGIAISGDAAVIYVTDMSPQGKVYVINTGSGIISKTINVGHTPVSPVLNGDESKLYVCNRFSNSVSEIVLSSGTVTDIPVLREPVAAVLTGRYLYVANHLPAGAATADTVAACVSVIDTAVNTVSANIQLPNGSSSLKGICASADGANIFVTHILGRYAYPTSQLDRGWVNTNALSIINTSSRTLNNTVLLDDVDLGAANPYAVKCTADKIVVSHAGSQEISIIDRAGLFTKLSQVASGQLITDTLKSAGDVPNDLSFLGTLRKRVRIQGNGPRAMEIAGGRVYVPEYFTDSVGILNLGDNSIKSVAIGPIVPVDIVRRGEIFWNNGAQCYQKWESCVSCHPDGRTDALNWDNLNDGIGSLKQTKSMLYSMQTPPSMITGVRADGEVAVRKGMSLIQFNVPDEEDVQAVMEYLRDLKPVPSPYLEDGQLSASALRGKEIFEGSAGCAACHPSETLFTDMKLYKVGTNAGNEQRSFDTPTLEEVWRTAPYLYDGRAATMREVLTTYNIDDRHGVTSNLTGEQLADLENYVMSIGDDGGTYVPPGTAFADNFDDGNADGWTPYGGLWTVTDGKYTVAAGQGAKSIANKTSFSDFIYEGDITAGSTGNAGVIFRVSNPGVGPYEYQGYYAGVSAGSVQLEKSDGSLIATAQLGTSAGSWTEAVQSANPDSNRTDLVSTPAAIRLYAAANTPVHMKIIAVGPVIKVYVDDMSQPRINVIDSSYTTGAVGVRTYNSDAGFDNISVLKYTSPPAIPSGLTATAAWTDTVNLSWPAVSGAVSYNVYRSMTSGAGYEKINASPVYQTRYADTGLLPSTAYFYKVSAVSTGGESELSVEAAAITGAEQSTSFSDNFDDGNANGWTTYGGTWTVSGGQYSVGADPGAKSIAANTSFSDLVYEGDITVGSAGNAGLVFRVNNPGIGADAYQGYYAGISASGTIELGKGNNNWTSLGTASMAITAGQAYHMKVIAEGSSIKVYVDDMNTPKINVNDSSYGAGSIGVRTYNSAAGFDNIRATLPSKNNSNFSDDFDDGDAAGWTAYGGVWNVSGGAYNVGADPGAKSIAANTSFSDFIYEGDVTVGSTGNAGLIFRVNNPGIGADAYQGYYAGISASGTIELGKGNNNWTSLGTASMTINAGQVYRMRVVAAGSNIKVYVGDFTVPKIDVSDSSFAAGAIGVRTYNAGAVFDNIHVGKILFNDNFDDGNAAGWTTYGGTWTVSGGKYNVGANPGAKSIADNTNFSDFTYEGDVTVGSAGNAGLIFRVSNPGAGADSYQGYYAGISASGNVELGKGNNNWTSLGVASMTINANQVYHMKIVANGYNIKIYVEDMNIPKLNATDTSYTAGMTGVRTYNAAASFDNMTVTE